MPALLDILLLGVSIGLLWIGGEWIVDGAARLGRSLGLSELVIGLTVVAFGTSAPEFAVTVSAALGGRSEIALANVVGSNVFNIGIILGGCALMAPLLATRTAQRRDGPLLVAAAIFVSALCLDGRLSRLDGFLLFASLIAYLGVLWKMRAAAAFEEEVPSGPATPLSTLKLVGGLASVALGGHLLVSAASEIARVMGVPEWIIGLTIVAAGTSASELATSAVAVARSRPSLLVGNLIGSDIFNLCGVLGVAALLRPLDTGAASGLALLGLVATCLAAALFMRSGGQIGRAEGAALVLLGLLRWAQAFIE